MYLDENEAEHELAVQGEVSTCTFAVTFVRRKITFTSYPTPTVRTLPICMDVTHRFQRSG
jgi:hypothetical protein